MNVPAHTHAVVFRPRVFELRGAVDIDRALARVDSARRPVLLDSAAGLPRRATLLGLDPVRSLEVPFDGRGMDVLRELVQQIEATDGEDVPGPFHGGFLGALSYDLGADGERAVEVAPEPWRQPAVVGGLYTDFWVRDEGSGCSWLVLGEDPGDGRAPLAERRAELTDLLCGNGDAGSAGELLAGELERHTSAGEHRARVDSVRGRIAVGDLYQANLAHRFTCAARGHPAEWYARLRRVNPAPYMGFVGWPTGALLSASPELMLEYDGALARSRPIKGTAPRDADPARDRAFAEALLASEKDRAELVMIVDLVRNDLGRLAQPGRVWVESFPRLQSYARVHHLMADVVAEPRRGVGAIDLLAALFPGGSITGAPKLRAMDVIAELEGEGRGFFTGCLGFVDTRGRCAFNILIRTLLWRPRAEAPDARGAGELSFRVGGGITWSSDPAAEDDETLHKAAGMIDALRAVSPPS